MTMIEHGLKGGDNCRSTLKTVRTGQKNAERGKVKGRGGR